jgi:hypothetical protein
MQIDPRFAAGFERLIRDQFLDDLDGFLTRVELFDEPPLYSRFDQLTFLDGVPVEERNRLLVRAAAAHLPAIVGHARGHDSFCMLSILGWEDFDGGSLITPTFFVTNPSTRPDPEDPRGILDYLCFDPPTSHYSAFVADALEHDPRYLIHEDLGSTPGVMRVYVRIDRKAQVRG